MIKTSQLIRYVTENPESRRLLLPYLWNKSSAFRSVLGTEFNSKEDLKKYLDEHPDADRSKHSIKKPKKTQVSKDVKEKQKKLLDELKNPNSPASKSLINVSLSIPGYMKGNVGAKSVLIERDRKELAQFLEKEPSYKDALQPLIDLIDEKLPEVKQKEKEKWNRREEKSQAAKQKNEELKVKKKEETEKRKKELLEKKREEVERKKEEKKNAPPKEKKPKKEKSSEQAKKEVAEIKKEVKDVLPANRPEHLKKVDEQIKAMPSSITKYLWDSGPLTKAITDFSENGNVGGLSEKIQETNKRLNDANNHIREKLYNTTLRPFERDRITQEGEPILEALSWTTDMIYALSDAKNKEKENVKKKEEADTKREEEQKTQKKQDAIKKKLKDSDRKSNPNRRIKFKRKRTDRRESVAMGEGIGLKKDSVNQISDFLYNRVDEFRNSSGSSSSEAVKDVIKAYLDGKSVDYFLGYVEEENYYEKDMDNLAKLTEDEFNSFISGLLPN